MYLNVFEIPINSTLLNPVPSFNLFLLAFHHILYSLYLYFWLFVYLQAASNIGSNSINIKMCVAFSAFQLFFFSVHSECEIFPPLRNTMHKICHHWFNIAINGYCVCLTTFLLNTIFSFIFFLNMFVCQLLTTMVKRSSYECLWLWCIINHFP